MNKIFKLCMFMFLLVLAGCELNEDVIRKEDYAAKVRETSFEQLLGEKTFLSAYNRLHAGKRTSRTVMEAQYGFTIVPYRAKVIESGKSTSYTFKITREITSTDYFENLVINVDSLNQVSAYIIKYTPHEAPRPSAHNSFTFKGDVKLTPIVYDVSETGKDIVCHTATVMMCNEPWTTGGSTEPHAATANCNNPNHLFSVTTTTCDVVGGGGSFGAGGGQYTGGNNTGDQTGSGGGGDGEPSTSNPPTNCPRCPVIITAPVEQVAAEPPLHCEKLNDLLKSFNFKQAINKLKTPQVLDGAKEQGFNLTLNSKGNLVLTEVPEVNTGDSYVNYSFTSPFVFGGLHCHRTVHAPMFSHADVFLLTQFYSQHNYIGNEGVKDATIPVHILVSSQGTYAISADNLEAVHKLKAIYLNKKSRNRFNDAIDSKYQNLADKNTLLPAGYPVDYQKAFLTFLKDNDINVSLYKLDDNLAKWTKLALNENPNTQNNEPISKTNCN